MMVPKLKEILKCDATKPICHEYLMEDWIASLGLFAKMLC